MVKWNESISPDIVCPSCNKKFNPKISLKSNESKTNCPNCKQSITFDTTSLNKSLKDVDKQIKNLFKKFK